MSNTTIVVNGRASRDSKGKQYRTMSLSRPNGSLTFWVYNQSAERTKVENSYAELADAIDACKDPVKKALLEKAADAFPKTPAAFRFWSGSKSIVAQGVLNEAEIGKVCVITVGVQSEKMNPTTGKVYKVILKEDQTDKFCLTFQGYNEEGHSTFLLSEYTQQPEEA